MKKLRILTLTVSILTIVLGVLALKKMIPEYLGILSLLFAVILLVILRCKGLNNRK